MELRETGNGVDSWKEVNLIYNAALRQIETKMEILNEEFQHVHQYNPIEHIKSRIKTPESIVKKLRRHGYESTIENMIEYVNDIAGIRIICSFTSDRIVDTKVEIQIRTVAMDFWASLEHKIHYKFEGDAPEHIQSELIECAKLVADLDARMLTLNEEILAIGQTERIL